MPGVVSKRDIRLDLFRGLALWTIFVNHIPDNPLSIFTTRSYGFSDAAEIFLLVSGTTAGMVYGRMVRDQGTGTARRALLRRIWVLYQAQIVLLIAYVGLAILAGRLFGKVYWDGEHLSTIIAHPILSVLELVALTHQPTMVKVLPMYIFVMAELLLIIPWLISYPLRALGASLCIYLLVQITGLGSPGEGYWYFNPLAWQFLFVIGAAIGAHSALARGLLIENRPVRLVLTLGAWGFLVFALVLVAFSHFPGLRPYIPFSADPDIRFAWKADLAPLRLIHCLALAYAVISIVPRNSRWIDKPWFKPVSLCGRHGLAVYSVGTLLSYIGWVLMNESGDRPDLFLLVDAIGIGILICTAAIAERRRMGDQRPVPQISRLEDVERPHDTVFLVSQDAGRDKREPSS